MKIALRCTSSPKNPLFRWSWNIHTQERAGPCGSIRRWALEVIHQRKPQLLVISTPT